MPSRRNSRALAASLGAALVAAAIVLGATQTASAQFVRLGPRTIYPNDNNFVYHPELPLVMRDAIQHIAIGTRLIDVKPRIMGGVPAPNGAFPWMASLGLKGTRPLDGHFCGGAFINANWVITAAHCVKPESASKIQVVGGTNTLEVGGTVYPVDRVIVHEKYDEGTQENDVALLHLSKAFAGPTLRLLAAGDAERLAPIGGLATVAGWGLSAEGSNVENRLRQVTVQIASNKSCNSTAAYGGTITDGMMCAGFAEGGKDSCQGDSGGPLMVADGMGNFYQAGIVSWGEGCGRPLKFGVYTRVSLYQQWVADAMAGRVASQAAPAPSTESQRLRRAVSGAAARSTPATGARQTRSLRGALHVGPKSLYPRDDDGSDTPLVMRDALRYIQTKQRLLDVSPRIMGGEPAPAGAYPWAASLELKGSKPLDGHFCGGSFVAADWVLTAAHCVKSESASKIQVYGGSNQLSSGGTVYAVDRVVVHEGYDDGSQENDVAMLHLAQRANVAFLRPLPADADRLASPGQTATAIGWGLTAEGTDVQNVLRRVGVQIVSNETCNGAGAYGGGITSGMLCAGFAAGGKDSCQGDSGGPLVVSDGRGGFFQAGVVSWGEGCGRPNKFGVYTRVSVYQPWIADRLAGKPQPPRAQPRSAQTLPAPATRSAAPTVGTNPAAPRKNGVASNSRAEAPKPSATHKSKKTGGNAHKKTGGKPKKTSAAAVIAPVDAYAFATPEALR